MKQNSDKLLKILYHQGRFDEILKNALFFRQQHPNNPDVMTILGLVYSSKNKLLAAKNCFEKVLEVQTDSSFAYHNLAKTHHDMGEYHHALHIIEKSIKCDPNNLKALNLKGATLFELNKIDESIKVLTKAIALDPNHFDARLNLGMCQIANGEFKEGEKTFSALIKDDPNNSYIHYNYSRVHKYQKKDPHITVMKEAVLKNNISTQSMVYFNFALGKAHADIKDFNHAFTFWQKGNKFFNRHIKYNIKEDLDVFKSINHWADQPTKIDKILTHEQIPIFILGMPRSGTSLVEQILSGHDKIYAAGELELMGQFIQKNFPLNENITSDMMQSLHKHYIDGLGQLRAQSKLVTDKAPLNFRWIRQIRTIFPDSPIIHLKRHPMAVCFSNFRYFFRSRGMQFSNDLLDIGQYYIQYDALMKRWHKEFGDHLISVEYEKLTDNPRQEIENLLLRLDLDWQDTCLKIENNKRSIRTTSDTQIRQKIYTKSSEEWQNYEEELAPLKEMLMPILKRDGWV